MSGDIPGIKGFPFLFVPWYVPGDFCFQGSAKMESQGKRLANISIVVRDRTVVHRVNQILSEHGEVIRGRLGLPYHERGVSIIIVLIDADNSTIGTISGSLGNIPGVSLRSTILL